VVAVRQRRASWSDCPNRGQKACERDANSQIRILAERAPIVITLAAYSCRISAPHLFNYAHLSPLRLGHRLLAPWRGAFGVSAANKQCAQRRNRSAPDNVRSACRRMHVWHNFIPK